MTPDVSCLGPAPSPLRAGVGAAHTPQLRGTLSPRRPSDDLRFPAWTDSWQSHGAAWVPLLTGLVRAPPRPRPPAGGPLPALGPTGGGCGLRESGQSKLIPTPEMQLPPAAPRPCPRRQSPAPGTPFPGSRRCSRRLTRGGPPSPQSWTQRGPKLGVSGARLGGGKAGGRTDLFHAAQVGGSSAPCRLGGPSPSP